MAIITLSALKALYQTGDIPTEANYIDFIDTLAASATDLDLVGTTLNLTLRDGTLLSQDLSSISGGASDFDQLTDTPAAKIASQLVAVNSLATALEYIDPATVGTTTFDGLTDTPVSKTANFLVGVNAAGTDLEYVDPAGINTGPSTLTTYTVSTDAVAGVLTIDLSAGEFFRIVADGNFTLSYTGEPSSGNEQTFSVRIDQDVVGNRIITYASNKFQAPRNINNALTTGLASAKDEMFLSWDEDSSRCTVNFNRDIIDI